LVEQCVAQLIDNPEKGGHYFTIWAPRQTGKTWLMRQVKQEITQRYGEQVTVCNFSFDDLRGIENTDTFPKPLRDILQTALPGAPQVQEWNDFVQLFARKGGLWDRPLILLIDAIDTAPLWLLDLLLGHFRELYLSSETNWLHGLALIGVYSVLGIESQRGSPFNIQRSLHVPNFTPDEVRDLYRQYQAEHGQPLEPAVIEEIYQATHGHPGLACWFGELLTEKYNPGGNQPIDVVTWELVRHQARVAEPNNTILNLIAKARLPEYQDFLLELFTHSDLTFSLHDSTVSYLYTHGLIEPEIIRRPSGEVMEVCRFSSPFIQAKLYYAFSADLIDNQLATLALHPLDDLADVFQPATGFDLPALFRRYKEYLARLKAKGVNPWQQQPRRQTDLHLTEAVGHFHLYAWLQTAIGRRCAVSPEFPTGNGRVDLHIRCGEKRGIIEVKSFVDQYQAREDRQQAARYAKRLGVDGVTLATFVPIDEEAVLQELSVTETIAGVVVNVVAIGWT